MSLILSGTDGLSDVDGTAATPAIRGADTNTGIFFPAADTVAASVGGTEGLRLTTTGLTIGGSTPRLLANMSGSPQSGRFAIQNSTTDGNTRFYLYPNGTGNISAINMWNNSDPSAANYSSVDIGIISTSDVRFSSQASGSASVLPMTWYMGASERMRLDASGNLGLGVTPSSWQATFKAIDFSTTASLAGSSGGANLFNNAYWNGSNYIYKTTAAAARYLQSSGEHYWYTAPSGTAGNSISFTQVLAVEGGKSLALENATSQSGTGITFPATQSASSNANTLDDYEEGTWTPTISPEGSAFSTLTYTYREAKYTKIGNTVFINIYLLINSVSGGSSNVNITGLPFTVAAGAGNAYPLTAWISATNWSTTYDNLVPVALYGGTTVWMTLISRNNGYGRLQATDLAAGNEWRITGFYNV